MLLNAIKSICLMIDLMLIYHNNMLAMQCAIFSSLILLVNIYHFHLISFINNQLDQLSMFCKKQLLLMAIKHSQTINAYNQPTTYHSHLSLLKQIRFLHLNLAKFYLVAYPLYSKLMFFFLICSLPFNAICLLSLSNDRINIQHLIAVVVVITLHASTLLTMLFTLAWQTETLHQSKKFLFPIVQWINIKVDWRLKLQFSNWFGQVISNPKYGPYIFIIGNIHYNSIMNVSQINNNWHFV